MITHDKMIVNCLTPESHANTCGYWYTVTAGSQNHTAFRTREALDAWLNLMNLEVQGEIPKDLGEGASLKIEGRYHEVPHDLESLSQIDPEFCAYSLNNADYTIAKVTRNDQGEMVVNHFWSPIYGETFELNHPNASRQIDKGNLEVAPAAYEWWEKKQRALIQEKKLESQGLNLDEASY